MYCIGKMLYLCIRINSPIKIQIMKDFLKYVVATLVGIIAFFIVTSMIGMMSIVGMIAASSAAQTVEDNSVFVLDINGYVDEQAQDITLSKYTSGTNVTSYGLNDILSAIKKAKDEDNIKGIFLNVGNISASYATLQEIRSKLEDFRKSGKWIIAYSDSYTQGAYYLASIANSIYINPQGMLDWHGIASQPMYYKDLAAKFGIKYQVVKVGTYKSATEVFTEDHMTEANRIQTQAFINNIWHNVCAAVSKSRGISPDSLNSYADQLTAFQGTNLLKKRKLIDGTCYGNEIKNVVKKKLGIDTDDDINKLSLDDMANVKEKKQDGDEIAVYYAYGDIVQEASNSPLASTSHSIVANKVCKDLADFADDDDIKAVVLRINSGGGDAYASEQIWHQISELKKKKPVVVSMGDYAASGAYYMSAPASWIVAQPNTLTGSIGIFAVFPDWSGLVTQKLGVKFDEVKTNRNAAFGNTLARPFNAEETAMLQQYVNRGYQLFRQRVATGRKMSIENVERIAQGRVWAGNDAINIKLVDQLGGLDDAVKKAAQLAKIKEYYTAEYPSTPSWIDQLLDEPTNSDYLDSQLRLALGDFYMPLSLLRNINQHQALQARIPFVINMR